nr:hypothetical protein CFP56_02754 [Quercus suber]
MAAGQSLRNFGLRIFGTALAMVSTMTTASDAAYAEIGATAPIATRVDRVLHRRWSNTGSARHTVRSTSPGSLGASETSLHHTRR